VPRLEEVLRRQFRSPSSEVRQAFNLEVGEISIEVADRICQTMCLNAAMALLREIDSANQASKDQSFLARTRYEEERYALIRNIACFCRMPETRFIS